MAQEQYALNDVDKAKECIFLKVYDDIFNQNSGFDYKITTIGELQEFSLGRGAILNETESCDYERFKLCVDEFYPKENLDITEIKQQENKILIRMKSTSKSCMCPKCTCISETYHGTQRKKLL